MLPTNQPPPPPAYYFHPPIPPALAAKKAIQRVANLTGAALLSFQLVGAVILLVPLTFIDAFERMDMSFLVTLACNGLTGFIVLYCIFSALMKPLNCRDAVGRSFGKPIDGGLVVCALLIGFGWALCSDQLTNGFLWLLENFFHVPTDSLMPDILPKTYDGPSIAMLVVQIAVSPALLEEFAFRGVMLQSLRRYGDKFAIFASALVFGVFHGNVVQAPFAFLLGLVLGWLTVATGSVWTAVLIHFANNFNSVVMTVYQDRAGEEAALQAYYIELFVALALGAIALVIFLSSDKRKKLAPVPDWVPKKGRARDFFTAPGMLILLILLAGSMLLTMFLPQIYEFLGIEAGEALPL